MAGLKWVLLFIFSNSFFHSPASPDTIHGYRDAAATREPVVAKIGHGSLWEDAYELRPCGHGMVPVLIHQ